MNNDILTIIADYVPIELPLYCRLASVNRDFYGIFTSDKLWRRLDVYDEGHDIYNTFKNSLTERDLKCLHGFYHKDYIKGFSPQTVVEITKNRFAWLLYICSAPANASFFAAHRALSRVALVIVVQQDPTQVEHFFSDGKNDELAHLALATNIQALWHIPILYYADDLEFKMLACSHYTGASSEPAIVYGLDPNLSPDHELWQIAIAHDIRSMAFAPHDLSESFFEDEDRVLEIAKVYPRILQRTSPLNDNKKFIMALFSSLRYSEQTEYPYLSLVSEDLRRDYEVCKLALEIHPREIDFVLCTHPDIFTPILAYDYKGSNKRLLGLGDSYYFRQYPYQTVMDVDYAVALVEISSQAFISFPEFLRGNRRVAVTACGLDPLSSKHVPDPLAQDPSFWIECIESAKQSSILDEFSMVLLEFPMLDRREVAVAACRCGLCPTSIDSRLGTKWSTDRDLIMLYLNSMPWFFNIDSFPKLYDDEEAMLALVGRCGQIFTKCSARLQKSRKLMQAAFTPRDTYACFPYRAASRAFGQDHDFIASLGELSKIVPPRQLVANAQNFDWEKALLETLEQLPDFYPLGRELRESVEFNVAAVRANPLVLNSMSKDMINNPAVMEALEFKQLPQGQHLCYDCFMDLGDLYNELA